MALSLLCGGLGVASAADVVHVDENATGAAEVYTKTGVDTLLDKKADKTAVEEIKNTVGGVDSGLVKKTADNANGIEVNRTNINTLKDTVGDDTKGLTKKINDNTAAIAMKADTAAVTTLEGRVGDVEGKVTTLEGKVGDASSGLVKDVNDLRNQGTTLNNALGSKADKNDLEAATNRITANEGKITDLQKKTAKLSADGMTLTDMTTVSGATVSGTNVEAGALKVTGQISNGTVATTLTDINLSMEQTKKNTTDIDALKNTTTEQQTTIDSLKEATTRISYDKANDTTSINGMKVGQRVDMGGKDLTRVGAINGTKIGTKVDGTYIHQGSSIWENMKNVDTQVGINTTAIAALDTKVGTVNNGTYLDSSKSVGENLNKLNDGLVQEVTDRKAADDTLSGRIDANANTIAKVNQELVNTNNHFNTELRNTNAALQEEGKARAEADAKINTKIGNIDDTRTVYVKDANSISQNLTTLDEKLQNTNDRTGGIKRNTEDTQTTIEDSVKVDNQGNVKDVKNLGAETITTTGNATIGGTLGVNGATTLGGTLTAKDNAKFEKNVTVDKDLTVTGKLNVDKISMKNDEQEATGKQHDSATTITADGITNRAKVTDENGNTTESQFTHNEKGTFNYAKDEKITGEWKGATSNVTADGVSNKMTDSAGNTHTYYQTATESKEQLVNGNKSNFERKTAEGNTISIKDKDADGNKKSLTNKQTVDGEKTSVTNKESSSTINQGADQIRNYVASTDGTKSSTEVKADGITNTSDGTITNDANHIENKANTMDTTVTGKATESYGELETTVNGNQTTTVKGNVKEDYKKDLTTTVGGNELHEVTGTKTENVTGKVTENYKGGQETNVTGDQVIKVSGTQTTTATDIKRNASSGMIDTIDNDYGTNTETKVAGKTTTDVSIKGTGEEGHYIRGANESRDYLIKGTLKNSETKTVEKTSTEITDGTNKASTIQDAKNLAGSVTNGTETGVSGIHANDDSVSIDSIVTDGNKSYSVINQKKGSIQSTVVDGTNSTVILQDKDNVTIASSNGTVGLVGKDIVNKAQDTITNTAGTSITNQVNDSKVTTDANGTTFENKTAAVSDGGMTTTKINGNHINTGRVDANELGVSDKDGANTADFSVKAGEGVKASAGNGTTTGSLDVKADEVVSSVTNTDGTHTNMSQTADGIKGYATDKDGNKTYTKVTATENSFQVQDKDGKNKNHQVNTMGSSVTEITDKDGNTTKTEQTATDITNEASNSITDKVGTNTRVLNKDGITDTVGGSTFKQRINAIMMESKDVSIKAEETLTNEAKVITNKASEVINNEAVNINNTATGIITSKASEIKNQADKLISNKVGENTWENMEDGKITTSIKDGTKQNLTQSDAAGTTQSTVDGVKSTVTIQNADGLTDVVTDGKNTSIQNQTAFAIQAAVKDKAGNENASLTDVTTSANTIKNGTKANTVISTADGTSFINSEAAAPVTGASGAGTHLNTTIKGNTITTGKVTMDYAEVMKDLGVTGKTTTGSLEVKGESKLTGNVTMENNATVGNDLTVKGITNTKTLNVTEDAKVGRNLAVDGNATIAGDVTARSYNVGGNTYIDADGIHANNQKITDVADGSISEGSKDAVNGGQLYNVKNDLEGKVNKVGANAAAMANLHPMEFDPDSKWNIAAAIGNYGSETAAALGAFYRPNDDVMVNLSTAFGTGENMVGGGVSVRLGKGGNKLSREESNALKDQVNDLTARMDALLSVLNPNMSKDFPDVPENHWAYEAVSRLAGNDIVQGYPDGEFHGERTMTRYEMAEIIYNALSRGAEAEKELVEEFKPELQAMAASEKATAERAEG